MPPSTTFCVISRRRPDLVGGGASSRNFPREIQADHVCWGGGGVFFSGTCRSRSGKLPQLRELFYISGTPRDHLPFLETYRSACTFKERNNINSLHTKTFTKSLGGGHGPRGPPGYATGANMKVYLDIVDLALARRFHVLGQCERNSFLHLLYFIVHFATLVEIQG